MICIIDGAKYFLYDCSNKYKNEILHFLCVALRRLLIYNNSKKMAFA